MIHSMLEKAGQAACANYFEQIHDDSDEGLDGDVDFVKLARAVLAAIREPDMDTVAAGLRGTIDPSPEQREPPTSLPYFIPSIWRAMIDKLLEDK